MPLTNPDARALTTPDGYGPARPGEPGLVRGNRIQREVLHRLPAGFLQAEQRPIHHLAHLLDEDELRGVRAGPDRLGDLLQVPPVPLRAG